MINRQEQLEERLSREASLAIHHEFEVDDELESSDGYFAGDRLSNNDLENVSLKRTLFWFWYYRLSAKIGFITYS